MDPSSDITADELLFDVLAVAPEGRDEFLRRVCGDRTDVAKEVRSLLRAHESAGAFLQRPALLEGICDYADTALSADGASAGGEDPHIDERIGAYRVVRHLGSGGMGEVYLASREDEAFDRMVAVKFIRADLRGADAGERFAHERQILAALDHPNIARLIDGGTTEDGRPYLIMEYVDGVPIDRFCDARRLTIDERLKLFLTVCDAVQFAHRALVVHRDLKPANIMVAEGSGGGVVKLLDFGLAKILSSGADDRGDPTVTAQRRLTPAYASPEQLRPAPGAALTTSTDVYSLGVVLYELLTGRRPYRLRTGAPHELEQAVCSDQPTRPSEVVRLEPAEAEGSARGPRSAATGAALSALRGTDPSRLRRRLRGDLENILLMALRKEPHRRYASVEQFAEDIRRSLRSLPVVARRDSAGYRASRFMSRNRFGVGAAVLMLALLVGSLVLMSSLYLRSETARIEAAEERDRAVEAEHRAELRFNQVRGLARTLMFDMHDQIEMLAGATPTRHLLVQTSITYLDSLATEAGDDITLLEELAAGYEKMGRVQGQQTVASLGDPESALESFERGLAIRLRMLALAPERPGLRRYIVRAQVQVARMLMSVGRSAEAETMLQESVREARRLVDAESQSPAAWRELFIALTFLGNHQIRAGAYEASLATFESSRDVAERLLEMKPDDEEAFRDVTVAWSKIGDALCELHRYKEAEEAYLAHLTQHIERASAAPHNAQLQRDLMLVYMHLNRTAQATGRLDEAALHAETALGITNELAARDPLDATGQRDRSIMFERVAEVHELRGDYAAALHHFRRSYEISLELERAQPDNADNQASLAWCGMNVARLLNAVGEHAEAVRLGESSLAIADLLLADDPDFAFGRSIALRSCSEAAHGHLGLGAVEAARPHADRLLTDARSQSEQRGGDIAGLHMLARALHCAALVAHASKSPDAIKLLSEAEATLLTMRDLGWAQVDEQLYLEVQALLAAW